jgi:hypothetical protein
LAEPRPSALRFAAFVFEVERLRHGDAPLVVAQEIGATLHDRVGAVIGSHGFDVLLGRALVLARRGHPTLAILQVQPGGGLAFEGDESPGSDAMRAAITAVVAHLVEVLTDLIGEDLALRLVRDAWPEAASEPSPELDEKKK